MPRKYQSQATVPPELYLKKSFLQIIGTSLDILSKERANEAEDILQRINAAFCSKKPIETYQILTVDCSHDLLSPELNGSGKHITIAENENSSFDEDIDSLTLTELNCDFLQTSKFSDIATLMPPTMSASIDVHAM
ncbi:uncharacterized protein LOC142320616 [Lycorma delicatula]|uniref:uncharacterized protein LOC142320616 n=1 Tax=Lycorma delicatula TaxID=130591 RepID=UPI003F514E1B